MLSFMDSELIRLAGTFISRSRKIVFFGGAGVSTASNIPDFRSADGIYNRELGLKIPPETILSHHFFVSHPEEYYRFHRKYLTFPNARPNPAHNALVELEKQGRLSAIITQNIDGLHQKAGSTHVIELHGNISRYYCMACGRPASEALVNELQCAPHCRVCGGIIRPDVVLYEEMLDQEVLREAVSAVSEADMLIVGGTSLVVYPAAGLLRYYAGDRLLIINQQATPFDDDAALVIHGDIAMILPAIVQSAQMV